MSDDFYVILYHPWTRRELRSLWRENVSQTAERVGLEITDRIFKIRNNVVAILLLLETSKGHSRTRNVLECGHEKKTHN